MRLRFHKNLHRRSASFLSFPRLSEYSHLGYSRMKTLSHLLLLALVFASAASFSQQPSPDQNQAPPQRRGGAGGGFEGRQFRGTMGEVTAISGSSLKIKLPDGSIGTVNTTSDTRFRKDQQ